jgi:hypothetical protein
MSARFNFAKQSKVQASSLFMTISVRVELEFLSIDSPKLTDDAAGLMNEPDLFESRYGNMFVRGMGRGGLFVGVLRIDTASSEDSMKLSAELEGSYGLFSAEAKTKLSELQSSYKNEVFVRQYWEGGPKSLTIDDPTDPLRLLENANTFIKSFDVSDAEVVNVAAPFYVTLAPTEIATGPAPPNPADIQRAQDVLLYCARKRSAYIDNLNLLQHIVDNASKYTFDAIKPEALHDAARKYEDDLMLISDCASSAIASRASAKYPEQFATERGVVFPSISMPTPLPVAQPAAAATPEPAPVKMIAVPDFASCTSQRDCTTVAEQHELTWTWEQVGGLEPVFRVISQEPVAGTQVPAGSIVKITAPPVGVPDTSGTPPVGTPVTEVRGTRRDHRR